MNKFALFVVLAGFLSGCAGYGNNNYKTSNILPSKSKVAIILEDDANQQAIAEGVRRGAINSGVASITFATKDNVPSDIEYLVLLGDYWTGCRSAGAATAGALVAGLTTALSPVTISGSATSGTRVNIVTVDRSQKVVGGGYLSRQGSSMLVNCEKQLTTIGESWAETQFKK